ncbi:guanine nucleotide exchange factor in mesoderm isoform 1-T2 [Cochliomyia hominivorax]
MDIESDDSERWEDFFGSSTDLTPSLLGIYDSLTTGLDNSTTNTNNNNNTSNSNSISFSINCDTNKETIERSITEDPPAKPPLDAYLSRLEKFAKQVEHKNSRTSQDCEELGQTSTALVNSNSNSGSCSSSLRGSLESVSSNSGGSLNKHRSNIHILSPNVQRIITHSDAEAVDAVDIEALQYQTSRSSTPVQQQHQRYTKKSTSPSSNNHKLKLSHIPLSKTTVKLTQTGTDLVETFNNILSEDGENFRRFDLKSKSFRKPSTPGIYPLPGVDDEKTPTNPSAFNFDCSLGNNKLTGTRKLSLPRCNYEKDCLLVETSSLDNKTNMSLECLPTENPITETINFAVVSQNLKNLTLAANSKEFQAPSSNEELFKALNKPVISINNNNNDNNSNNNKRSPTHHPLSYARSKSLAARDFAQKNINLKHTNTLPRSQFLKDEELDENQISAESLDRLSDIKSKFSPKETRKMSSLMLPDIAKLKHRPLSSSSICSTSSSSSSSSSTDHISGKLNTSYLASVESLADEHDLTDPHSGMSVFERACMEIVDSERSYVNDLGEVIRGYLLDWKERACLKQDDLNVLFSNIQDVYEYNSELLKHLNDSILDPVKIAKCFIDLKEGFDVYTTYCTSYPEAISLLTKLLQATHTNALLASTQRMLHHTLPLGSYLLKPVQRILKYHLLLDNLRKHCDIKEVMQAYEIMRQVARNIDQVKRKLEQQTRVKELSGILDGWLGPELTVLGELRLEGILMENNKPRRVLLFATMLIIAKAKEDNRLQFKSYIHQNNLMLSEHLAGEPTSFYVIPYDEPRHQIKLTAKNRDQKRLWTQHIKSVILEKFDNIPLRAKELVYQLGDEEDRSADKNTWKWSLHTSSSTPTYLERRNNFRRSEIRNRSKTKRKTISNTNSLDVFSETTPIKDTKNLSKSISKSAESINDKSSRESTAVEDLVLRAEEGEELEQCNCAKNQKCKCINNHDKDSSSKSNRQIHKSFRFGSKPLKERSKSVPRISLHIEHFEKVASEQGKVTTKEVKTVKDVNQNSSKTSPSKRLSTLKRQKTKVKETSTFYMALSEFEDASETVLKITESSENILHNGKSNEDKELSKEMAKSTNFLPDVVMKGNLEEENRVMSTSLTLTPAEKAKQDAEIVLDLLKNSKEFDKLYAKIQKKRSMEKSLQTSKSLDLKLSKPMDKLELPPELPPRPPSRSPPPLENEQDCMEYKSLTLEAQEEPIYESLLRNVHVPYKFSPPLGRSKSVQYNKNKEKKPASPRPESDYVTLVYTPEGILHNVGGETVAKTPAALETNSSPHSSNASSTVTLKERDSFNNDLPSDHNSLDCSNQMTASYHSSPIYSSINQVNQNTSSSARSFLKRLWSNSTLIGEELTGNRLSRSVHNLERRGSDSLEVDRHSILHLPGSEIIGERMAHVDYADPRTLFSVIKTEDNNQMQRDSVLSLTSSNDSVCEHKPDIETYKDNSANNFEYEDCVEACLENDFRDSAIYSDDNDRRLDKSNSFRNSKNPPLKPKPVRVPPLPLKSSQKLNEPHNVLNGSKPPGPGVIICPPNLSPNSTRSWVLQQIDNFSK